ncbi:hypothetical protein ANCCAN_23311 [Ancylostoma caninum]|uniref:Uncharacterized protein n=1 Tax=Ancylostoma caninum TaxID=29170 RepID=A0A368FL78_ANCCA|nr:hypothetical protein ANCCAN_23311 [Ancylostoma caninum]
MSTIYFWSKPRPNLRISSGQAYIEGHATRSALLRRGLSSLEETQETCLNSRSPLQLLVIEVSHSRWGRRVMSSYWSASSFGDEVKA